MVLSRSRAVLAALALAGIAFVWGCDGGDDKPLRDRPELTEDRLQGMMSAMRALQDKAKESLRNRPDWVEPANGAQAHLAGVGLAGFVGEAIALPIVEQHGFVSIVDYESTVAYTQQALSRVLLGPDGGIGGMGKSIRLEAELRELNDQLDQMRRGGTPTEGSEATDADQLKRRIDELKDQIESQAAAVATMKSGFSEIPRVSIDVVSKHRDELKALFSGS